MNSASFTNSHKQIWTCEIIVNKFHHRTKWPYRHHRMPIIKWSIHWIQLKVPIRKASPKRSTIVAAMMGHFLPAIHPNHCKFPSWPCNNRMSRTSSAKIGNHHCSPTNSVDQNPISLYPNFCHPFSFAHWISLVSSIFCLDLLFDLISPEFSYRPGLSALSEDATTHNASGQSGGGPPNRPLPPTPDDDDNNPQGDRTLIMKRVSRWLWDDSILKLCSISLLSDSMNQYIYVCCLFFWNIFT